MTDKTDPPIQGYRTLTDFQVAMMNLIKTQEEQILRLLDAMDADDDVDGRWMAIARTDLQKGFMALNRAVAKPQRISGDMEGKSTVALEALKRAFKARKSGGAGSGAA